ncbi:MAG TPA: protein translocase subunit SecF [Micromonosporaceae bacterium]|nr:protein translocase subunit SecF [Micromonosporaceae bacterium]
MASNGILRRLYRGETNIDFIGPRKRWYIASVVMIAICVASLAFKGFHFGIEFAGGNEFRVPVVAGSTVEEARDEVEGLGVEVASVQTAGTGGQQTYVVRTGELDDETQREVTETLAEFAGIPPTQVNRSEVSSSWGADVTRKALQGLAVFLLLVGLYIAFRFERKMAFAALLALLHDLILTAGVYSLVGFEVTPATVIGLLTILGFSLYDTVVVFDKVEENTKGMLGQSRFTYPEAANLAVNQTLMRSINTSLIALLPVGGLLFVGAGLLGVGTLKDLALVLFVGMLTGAYSSLFLATPWLVDFKLLEPRYKTHASRVVARRSAEAKGAVVPARSAKTAKVKPAAKSAAVGPADTELDTEDDAVPAQAAQAKAMAASGPRPGAKPAGQRSGGKRSGGARPGRPGAKRR